MIVTGPVGNPESYALHNSNGKFRACPCRLRVWFFFSILNRHFLSGHRCDNDCHAVTPASHIRGVTTLQSVSQSGVVTNGDMSTGATINRLKLISESEIFLCGQ